MALDSFDRNRWIAGIDHYIKEWEKQNYSLPSTPISSTPHSPANKSYRITNSRLLSIQTTPVTVQGTFHMNEIAPSPIANLNDSVPPSIRSKDNLITEEVGGEMGVQPIIESRSRTSTNQAM